MRSKKLIILASSFPNTSQTFVVSNIVAAIEKGFEVQVATKDKRPLKASSQELLLDKYKILEKTISFSNPTKKYKRFLFCFFCLLHPVVLWYFIKYSVIYHRIELNILFKLFFYKSFRKADIFHVHFGSDAEEIPVLKKIGFIKSKLIVTFHGYDAFFRDKTQQELLKSKYSALFHAADKLTVNTPFLKFLVLALGCPDSKLEVVPVGIDLDYFSPNIYPKKIESNSIIKLISVGRLIELKGHEFGIRVVKKLKDLGFTILYTIIGEGILFERIRSLIVELGLEESVVLFGRGTQEEIREAFSESQLFLMTSIMDETGREETQGVVTAEAQAMGLPVVGFKSGGVPYTVSKDTSILVDQKDITAMAAAVSSIILDPEKYTTMSLAARKWVEESFNLDTMVDDYYKDLL